MFRWMFFYCTCFLLKNYSRYCSWIIGKALSLWSLKTLPQIYFISQDYLKVRLFCKVSDLLLMYPLHLIYLGFTNKFLTSSNLLKSLGQLTINKYELHIFSSLCRVISLHCKLILLFWCWHFIHCVQIDQPKCI